MNFKRRMIILCIFLINIIISFILITEYSFAQVKPDGVTGVFISDPYFRFAPNDGDMNADAIFLDWRGILVGGDHGTGDIHHDNIYVRINNGPVIYQTTIPARKEGNLLPDKGLLWHLYTRDATDYSIYATSCWKDNTESILSDPLDLTIAYASYTCSEQTVPVAIAGEDQIVQIGDIVTLDASASFDPYTPDSSDLVYRWECYSAPESTVLLSNEGQTAVTSFTPNATGKYYFRLNVRDRKDGSSFNRSQLDYTRVSVVNNLLDPGLVDANSGRIQQVLVGETVVLDGSRSIGHPANTTYHWIHENPVGKIQLENLTNVVGSIHCQGECYGSNYDADSDVDGTDLAILVLNWGEISLPDEPVVEFVSGIARPHIFTLKVSDGVQTDSESTIVAVHHGNAETLLTPPDADAGCM